MIRTHPGHALALALLASVLPGCGGSKSSSSGTCQRAAVPATGPGDTLHYFPAEVGRSWTYGVTGTDFGTPVPPGTTSVVSVTGTQVVGGETASLFTTSASSGPEQVVKRPAGVYVLADPSVQPPLDQLYPTLVLPFPVAPTARTLQVQCTDIDLGDVDGDGKSDRGDITAYLRVISVTETASIQAGAFIDVAHVRTDASVTVRATKYGTVAINATEDDWYARDVGRVVSRLQMSSSGISVADESHSLISYTVPTAGLAPPRALAQVAAGADLAAPPADGAERAAMRLARQLVSAGR
jgi:hypothetical protein